MVIVWWPRASCTSLRVRPRCTSQEANVWRRSWNRRSSMPAAASADCQALRNEFQFRLPKTAFGLGRPAPGQDGVGVRAERHFAPPAALGQLQANDTASAIYTVPHETEGLAPADSSEQSELHEIGQCGIPTSLAGGEHLGGLFLRQPPEPSLRLFLGADLRDDVQFTPLLMRQPEQVTE